jgi:hypothetical protein
MWGGIIQVSGRLNSSVLIYLYVLKDELNSMGLLDLMKHNADHKIRVIQ